MFPYLVLMGIPSLIGFLEPRRASRLALFFAAIVYFLFIGFRWETGVDWGGYFNYIVNYSDLTLLQVWQHAEPGSGMLLWLANEIGWGHVGFNASSAAVFVWGVFALARRTLSPWVAVAVATSYIVLTVGMGTVRQAVACGLIFVVLAHWSSLPKWHKIVLILCASLFHFSALFMAAFLAFDVETSRRRQIGGALLAGAFAVLLIELSPARMEVYVDRYVGESAIIAPAAVLHALLNGIPAAGYLIFRRRFDRRTGSNTLLFMMALGCLAMIPTAFLVPIAATRLSMYLTAAPMMIWAAAPAAFGSGKTRHLFVVAALAAQAFVMIVWLNFANVSFAYFPYQNVLFPLNSGRI